MAENFVRLKCLVAEDGSIAVGGKEWKIRGGHLEIPEALAKGLVAGGLCEYAPLPKDEDARADESPPLPSRVTEDLKKPTKKR